MGLVTPDDGWRIPDWLWQRLATLLPAPPPPCGAQLGPEPPRTHGETA